MQKSLLLIISLGIFTVSLIPQDLTGVRIYVNPGHGGFDSNDRYIEETGFWESVGNLDKGLFLRDMLEDLNATVKMSRTTNFSSDDLPLSVIAAQANSFNADYFHSIHSNAFNKQANYTLLLFRGYDNQPVFPAAKQMGGIMTNKINQAHRTTAAYNRGDWTFYGNTSGLGVLRTLTMPGTLSEGSFHDYIPESWRLMNTDYKKHEAWAIAMSFLSFYSQPGYSHGMIAGIVRDPAQSVNYYAIPTTNDTKKPLNGAQVILLPDSIIYQGDELNNGFFLFDSLQPGTYKLIYRALNFTTDSSVVNVSANQTVFADKFLQFDTSIPPEILYHLPEDNPDSVSTLTNIQIYFTRRMLTSSVENALSITPSVDGTFTWDNDERLMTFIPSAPLQKATEYSVVLSADAMSFWNVPLQSQYSFGFTTINRDKLNLLSAYPQDGHKEISMTLQFRLEFDAPLFRNSLVGNVNLYDEIDQRVLVKNVDIFEINERGYIYFEPQFQLNRNAEYRLQLGGGIKDEGGFSLNDLVEIKFRTETELYLSGNIIEGFESIDGWIDPVNSGYSDHIDTLQTKFEISPERKYSGSYSGRLVYEFVDTAGRAVIINQNEPSLGQVSDSEFGIWIFGDLSNNEIRYWFKDDQANIVETVIDTLDWTGWKIKSIRLNQLPVSGNISLQGIALYKLASGNKSGGIYFDDMQKDILTQIENPVTENSLSYELEQNYPNPFNPSTKIRFKIPEAGLVSLTIYDILGNKVAALIDSHLNAGVHEIKFDTESAIRSGARLASGIYIYSLRVNDFRSSRKMILLK